MSNNSFALSRFDFESGRFTKVCRFITRNWPWDDAPSLSGAQEILAKYLGYDNFHEAQNSATERATGECNFFHYGDTTGIHALEKYQLQGSDFARTWPLQTLGRWNDNLQPCIFDSKYLIYAVNVFDYIWRQKSANYVGHFVEGQKAVADISTVPVCDILDSELIEALLEDAVVETLRELLHGCARDLGHLTRSTGFGYMEITELPLSEEFFPNLFQHLRDHVQSKWAPKTVYDALTRQRNEAGFYINNGNVPRYFRGGSNELLTSTSMEDGTFHFLIINDSLDYSPFRSYSWEAALISPAGDLLLNAVGSYISGPANESYSGQSLFLDLDQVGDADVQILCPLFQCVIDESEDIIDDEDLTPWTFDTAYFFSQGNFVTLRGIERKESSRAGIGAECLLKIFSILKRKYKRNMHFACIADAFQFIPESNLIKQLWAERLRSEDALADYFIDVASGHPNILSTGAALASLTGNNKIIQAHSEPDVELGELFSPEMFFRKL